MYIVLLVFKKKSNKNYKNIKTKLLKKAHLKEKNGESKHIMSIPEYLSMEIYRSKIKIKIETYFWAIHDFYRQIEMVNHIPSKSIERNIHACTY